MSEPTAKDALQAIANLPTGANEDVMRGQEEAYRAVEALFDVAPKVQAYPAPVTHVLVSSIVTVDMDKPLNSVDRLRALVGGSKDVSFEPSDAEEVLEKLEALASLLYPTAPAPQEQITGWIANCCSCGRIVDTREMKDGGDPFGAELSDGRWTCSAECWGAVVDPDFIADGAKAQPAPQERRAGTMAEYHDIEEIGEKIVEMIDRVKVAHAAIPGAQATWVLEEEDGTRFKVVVTVDQPMPPQTRKQGRP